MRPQPDIAPDELARMPLTCDTCHAQPGALWTFLYSAFEFTVDDGTRTTCDAGEWGACDECAAAITQRDWVTLMHRALEANPEADETGRAWIRALQAAFLAHVEPGSARRAVVRDELRVKLA